MSLQEQLNELYDDDKETLAYQARVLRNRHDAIPHQLTYLSQRTGMAPERIIACARMTALTSNPWYAMIEQMVMFYQNDDILTQKHKGDTPQ